MTVIMEIMLKQGHWHSSGLDFEDRAGLFRVEAAGAYELTCVDVLFVVALTLVLTAPPPTPRTPQTDPCSKEA